MKMDKSEILTLLDKEIEFAKGTGMPQFVMGLLQAKQVITNEFLKREASGQSIHLSEEAKD